MWIDGLLVTFLVEAEFHHFIVLNAGSKPLKERTSKAERRAKQEADRAAKLAAREVGKSLMESTCGHALWRWFRGNQTIANFRCLFSTIYINRA